MTIFGPPARANDYLNRPHFPRIRGGVLPSKPASATEGLLGVWGILPKGKVRNTFNVYLKVRMVSTLLFLSRPEWYLGVGKGINLSIWVPARIDSLGSKLIHEFSRPVAEAGFWGQKVRYFLKTPSEAELETVTYFYLLRRLSLKYAPF